MITVILFALVLAAQSTLYASGTLREDEWTVETAPYLKSGEYIIEAGKVNLMHNIQTDDQAIVDEAKNNQASLTQWLRRYVRGQYAQIGRSSDAVRENVTAISCTDEDALEQF